MQPDSSLLLVIAAFIACLIGYAAATALECLQGTDCHVPAGELSLLGAVLDLTSTIIAVLLPIILISRFLPRKQDGPWYESPATSPRHTQESQPATPLSDGDQQLQQQSEPLSESKESVLERQLTQANSALQQLLHDPAVQAALTAQPALQHLGLDPHRQPEFLPLASILQDSSVRAALASDTTTAMDVPSAVAVVTRHLLQHPRLLEHVLEMRVFDMGPRVELFNGRDWTADVHVKATSVALMMVAARDRAMRQALKQQLLPWVTQSKFYSWREINLRGFYHFRTDVLLYCLGERAVGDFQKGERVAAAMMLALMFQDSIML